ncbi:MAG: hypothetical protein K9L64_04680 [Candidatus Izimaplasma sp.]|nr:hypothetical protein [Candidatus Izimaplasma bacterium]
MKKSIILLFVLSCSLFLSACDYEYYLYHDHIRKETEVEKIELIRYNVSAENSSTEKHVFDSSNLEIIETLETKDIDQFLVELSEIGGLSSKLEEVLDFPCGKGIRITYIDRGFTIITVTGENDNESIFVGHYDDSENIEGYYSIAWQEMIDDFKELINDYFSSQFS